MFFSYDFDRLRNAYSHLLSSLSSHSVMIVMSDHRDKSASMALIKETKKKEKVMRVKYRSMLHTMFKKIEKKRNEQLHIKL